MDDKALNGDQWFEMLPRSPRYVIRLGEEQFVRFVQVVQKGEGSGEDFYSSKLLNISSTGLAFSTHRNSKLQVGEKIKIEFPIPGFQTVACWAEVVRIQEKGPLNLIKGSFLGRFLNHSEKYQKLFSDQILIGVHFYDMPSQHKEVISRAIEKKILEMNKKKSKAFLKKRLKSFKIRFLRLFLFGVFSFIVFYFLIFQMKFHEKFYKYLTSILKIFGSI